MNTIIEKLKEMLVVPVVVLDDVKDAEKLADALVGGGLPCAEVTFRTAAAEESIRIMTEKYPDMLDWLKSVDKIEKASSAVKWFFVTLIRCIVMVSVVLVMMIIAEFVLCCDYGAAGVGCIVMMYLLSSNRDVAFAVAVILLGLFSGTIEFFALFMLIPLRYYNGKRGISLKYVFYAFYPVHLFVLYLICRLAMAAVHT